MSSTGLSLLLLPLLLGGGTEGDHLPQGFTVELSPEGPVGVGVPVAVTIRALEGAGAPRPSQFSSFVEIEGVARFSDGEPLARVGPFEDGVLRLEKVEVPDGVIRVRLPENGAAGEARQPVLPGLPRLLPPLVAIFLALFTRQVLLSLFCGVWVGAAIQCGYDPLSAFLRSADTYLIGAVADSDHAHILIFSLSLAGMVGIITATGGIRGIVDLVSSFARGPRSGQLATWLLGVLIFFDDYANALLVGNTMRPFTDRVRISREKLSFIVDATAAPVATIGIISTWTAYQVGLVGDELPAIKNAPENPYLFFLASIPYSFYSFLMLLLVFLIGITLRDFGAMRQAEARTRTTGEVLRPGAQPLVDESMDRLAEAKDAKPRWYNAAVPISCVILFTLIGLYLTGLESVNGEEDAGLRDVIGGADSYRALLWAALGASAVAGILALAQKRRLGDVISSWFNGAKSLTLAVMILVLAWSISAVCKEIHTGGYVYALTRGLLFPQIVPALTFVVAGAIAFSTGTSYGTMGILIPILLPLAYQLAAASGFEPTAVDHLGLATLAAILGGAVFGDHCSPISDTTVLSSMASGADHIDHVRTQLPYAAFAAAIALPCYVATGFALTPLVILPVGVLTLAVVFFLVTRARS